MHESRKISENHKLENQRDRQKMKHLQLPKFSRDQHKPFFY